MFNQITIVSSPSNFSLVCSKCIISNNQHRNTAVYSSLSYSNVYSVHVSPAACGGHEYKLTLLIKSSDKR